MSVAGTRRRPLARLLTLHLPLALIVLFALGPYLWMLLTSIKPEAVLFSAQRTLLPHAATLDNYVRLFTKTSFVANIGHSLVARALFIGLEAAVREMKSAMRTAAVA